MSINAERIVWLMTLLTIGRAIGQSMNQPGLCSASMWYPDAITFANESIVGQEPTSLFVTRNSSVYVVENLFDRVQMWLQGSIVPTITFSGNMSDLSGLFVVNNGDVYIYHNASGGQIDKWSSNGSSSRIVMNVSDRCNSLFVDVTDTLYCTMSDCHQVVTISLSTAWNTTTLVAGDVTGTPGSTATALYYPQGIFVDLYCNLYVADAGNNRIQRFRPGQTRADTLIGSGGSGMIALNEPTAVILDNRWYLFIADTGNHRIVGDGPSGFRCVAACSNSYGSAASQLHRPVSLSFDRYANLFVTDQKNSRIQKFIRQKDPCGRSYNLPSLCRYAIWNSDGITLTSSYSSNSTAGVFVDIYDTVYETDLSLSRIQIWPNGNMTLARTISVNGSFPTSVSASITGDIYVDNGLYNNRVDQWAPNATSSIPVMNVSGACQGLFVDHDNNLYCSISTAHMVVKQSLSSYGYPVAAVAGNGSAGFAPNMLNHPVGIFVDPFYWHLYVADCVNNRVQDFRPGSLNGTTLAGNDIPKGAKLDCPVAIVMDYSLTFFILEWNNNRIVRVGTNGLRCLVGCTGSAGSASNQLNNPFSLSFDSNGNFFVGDRGNGRVQKFILTINGCDPPFNQPTFCPVAKWNPNATTVANVSMIGSFPHRLFVDPNNTLYVADYTNNRVQVWLEGNPSPVRTISGGLNASRGIFVTGNGDIYVDNSQYEGRVDRWSPNATNSTPVMFVNSTCFALFVDEDENLYCSMDTPHQVVKRSLSNPINVSTIVAGNGTAGSAPNMLNGPRGIFVDPSSDNLYVADCWNNRIQRFPSGQLNGITIAINGAYGSFSLSCPTDVALDSNKYLFVVDGYNNRILGSGPTGFRCIVACTGAGGSATNELQHPYSLSFDNYGNLFVADRDNDRVQKFYLRANACDETITTQMALVTTMSTRQSSTSIVHVSTQQQQPMPTTSQNVVAQQGSLFLSGGQSSQSFFVPACPLSSQMGLACNISVASCDAYQPCQNQGTCIRLNSTILDYRCLCALGFTGPECQVDSRPCQFGTCWNNGTCQINSNTTFTCHCQPGWKGIRCETKINYCENITCLNRGICHPLLLNYSCRCLGDSYSGRYCQLISTKTDLYQKVAKSFAYIAIIALTSVALLIIVLDVLKYVLHIDVAENEIQRMWQKKAVKQKKPSLGVRFIYVNAPLTNSTNQSFSNIEGTTSQ